MPLNHFFLTLPVPTGSFFNLLSTLSMLITVFFPISLQTGNAERLYTWFYGNLSFDNSQKIFSSETSYGTWHMNTLVIAISPWLYKQVSLPFVGHAYMSVTILLARKQFGFFLIILQMVPMAPSQPLSRWLLDLNAFEPTLSLILPFTGGGGIECLVVKGHFWYCS